ncbi:MAG: HAMP domain-containing histidine kinase [Bacteroidales bacterium]|jgi:signal transduction histidine kinase|nr:HAMP domain-containing histidine kinase [Bacteroidales bacterium]
MKIQTRLSLFTSVIFGIIFLVASAFIYGLFRSNAEQAIYRGLEKTAYLTAFFYLEEDELSSDEFAEVRRQFHESVNMNYQVYDMENNIWRGVETSKVSDLILEKIREKQALSFQSDDFFCHGIFYRDNQGDFVVVTKENRDVLSEQLSALLWILVLAFVFGILAVIFSSKWIAKMAYRPFSKVIRQVKNISTQNLNVQIKSSQTEDELQALINTFNELLLKISETVVVQKNFVKYVSHEFKTPLAALLGNLEVFLIKDRNPEEYKILAEKLVQHVHQLENILDTLMVISDLRNDTGTATSVRLDELVWEIIDQLKNDYPNSKVLVNVNLSPAEAHLLNIHKDRTQLLMALFNLIENAVKYSRDYSVEIELFKKDSTLCLAIRDNGIGIPPEQIQHVSKPFYRADNTNKIQGSGIGLSIALRILEKNDIHYEILSKEQEGVTVLLKFDL